MPEKPEPVLLTGATGFIGSAVLRGLLSQGRRVVALGRRRPEGRLGESLTFLQADLGRPATLRRHRVALSRLRLAVHLGGFVVASSRPEEDDAERAAAENALGTAALLDLLPGLCFLALASTIDVYGRSRGGLLRESAPPAPETHYAVSKLAAEGVGRAFGRRRGFPVCVLRLPQVYGPGDRSRKAVATFVASAAAGLPLTVSGGAERRGYLFIDDAADAFFLALDRRPDGVFNLAGPQPARVRDVARQLARLAGLPAPRVLDAPRGLDLVLDGSRARRELGFRPRVGLAEGLRRALAWARKRR